MELVDRLLLVSPGVDRARVIQKLAVADAIWFIEVFMLPRRAVLDPAHRRVIDESEDGLIVEYVMNEDELRKRLSLTLDGMGIPA